MDFPADALTSSIGALEYFDRKENQFYSHCTLDFPALTQDEVELVKNGSKFCSYYRDGLDIFGGPGVFVQRTKPGIPSPDVTVMDLTEESSLLSTSAINLKENIGVERQKPTAKNSSSVM